MSHRLDNVLWFLHDLHAAASGQNRALVRYWLSDTILFGPTDVLWVRSESRGPRFGLMVYILKVAAIHDAAPLMLI